MSEPLVYVVILAWNHKEMTLECIDSFMDSVYSNVRFLVVDNGSEDGTAEAVHEHYPNVEIVCSSTNLGVAGGYNLGIQAALERGAVHILVTNNDVEVDRDMLCRLVDILKSYPDVGMVMPKIYHYYGDRSRLWCTGARWRHFPPSVKMMGTGVKDSDRWSKLREIKYAPSCTLLIRGRVLQEIGGFDENYFFYNDDWDFSARLYEAGYKIFFVPEAKMWHKVSVSTQRSDKSAYWWKVLGRSTVRYYRKHSNHAALFIYAGWFVVREIIKLNFRRIPHFLSGFIHEVLLSPASRSPSMED